MLPLGTVDLAAELDRLRVAELREGSEPSERSAAIERLGELPRQTARLEVALDVAEREVQAERQTGDVTPAGSLAGRIQQQHELGFELELPAVRGSSNRAALGKQAAGGLHEDHRVAGRLVAELARVRRVVAADAEDPLGAKLPIAQQGDAHCSTSRISNRRGQSLPVTKIRPVSRS
jgi:hypothetical protein